MIFESLAPVVLIPILGYWYARGRNFPLDDIVKINNQVLLPCLIFYSMITREQSLLSEQPLLLATVLVVLASGALAAAAAKVFKVSGSALVPSLMFNNCGTIGIPLAMGISKELGDAAVLIFVVTNLLFSTVGLMIIRRSMNLWALLKTPLVIATVAGWALSKTVVASSSFVLITVSMCGTASPFIMLFCLGVTLSKLHKEDTKFGLLGGGLLRPAVGLLATGLVLLLPLGLTAQEKQLFLLFAFLPPALLNFQMALPAHALRISGMVFFGTVLSLSYLAIALPMLFAQGR